MAVSIRPARASDADDIARLATQLGYDPEPAAVAARLARILARPDHQFFIAEEDGRGLEQFVPTIAE